METGLRSVRGLIAALAIAALAGCGGSDGVAPPPPSEGSATLGAAGGTVPGPDGASVAVPAGALSAPLTLRVARDGTGAPPLPDDIPPLSGIYSFTPHGLWFGDTVQARIPFDTSRLSPGGRPVYMYTQPGGRWTMIVSDIGTEASALTAPLVGFSWGYVGDLGPANSTYPMSMSLVSPSPASLPMASATNSFRRLEQAQTIRLHAELSPYMTQAQRSGSCASTPHLELVRVIGPWPMATPYVQATGGITLPGAPVVGSTYGASADFDVPMDHTHNGTAYFLVRLYCARWHSDGTVDRTTETNPLQFGFVVLRVAIPIPIGAPTIAQQPQDITVVEGNRAEFRVTASAPDSLAVLWQRSADGGTTWTNTSVTGGVYTFAPAALADNGAKLRANVCNELGTTLNCITSNVVTLTVVPATVAPVFTQQPQPISVVEGQTASFSVLATATPTPTIRWYREAVGGPSAGPATEVGGPCIGSGGQTNCSYTTPALVLSDSGARFFAIATNGTENTMSSLATVTVTSAAVAPSIPSAEPADVTVASGQGATFTVHATGTAPLSYQWRRNGTSIAGANGSSYTLASAQPTDDGARFSVVVGNSAGTATSRDGVLTVNAAPPPPAGTGVCTSSNPAGWCWVQPGPHTNGLTTLALDGTMIFALGARTSMRSSDTGATWQTSFNAIDAQWNDVVSPAPGVLVAAATLGSSGFERGVYRSVDGGQSWASVLPNQDIAAVAFEDANNGVAVGQGIWRTTDGGQNWSVALGATAQQLWRAVSPAPGVYVVIGSMLNTPAFILRSVDGGQTWSSPAPNTTEQLADVAFGSATTGVIITGFGSVLRTIDGGATWSAPGTITPYGLATVAFADTSTVVAMSASGPVFRSTDGGINWIPGDDLGFSGAEQINRLRFRSPLEGYAVALYGQVWRTTDGGISWALVAGGSDLESLAAVKFRYAGQGLAAGLGGIYRTQDGGASWVNVDSAYSTNVAFLDGVTQVATGFGIRRTTDGGQTWTNVYTMPSGQTPLAVDFVPSTGTATIGVAVGTEYYTSGIMLRTVDSGVTWTPLALSPTPVLYSVAFSANQLNLGLVGGAGRTLLRTTDAGATWTPVVIGDLQTDEAIRSIAFGATGAIIATDTGLFRSADGGSTWARVFTSGRGSMASVVFIGATDVVAVGVTGQIARSADSGVTWTVVDEPITVNLTGVAYAGVGTTVIAVGDAGTILRNTQGGATALTIAPLRAGSAAVPAGVTARAASIRRAGQSSVRVGGVH